MSQQTTSTQFEDWVQEHHAAVYRTAYRLVQSAEDAQDVTQEVFIQALEQQDRIGSAEEPRRVLCWMAAKKALMHLRGDRRRKQREDEVAAMKEHDYVQPEHDDRIAVLLAKLPSELRLALSLRFQEELTFAQISEAMAISEPSAHDRVRRGLAKLREWLQRGSPAVLVIDLEQQLRDIPSASVPSGLSERLLRLEGVGSATMSLASKVLLSCSALLVVAAGIGAATLTGDEQPVHDTLLATGFQPAEANLRTSEVAMRTTTDERVDVARPAPSIDPEPVVLPNKRYATIEGRVLQADSTPAAGLRVNAASYVGSGMKIAAYGGTAITGEDGTYSMQVEVHHEDGEDYRVHVRYEKAIITNELSIRVVAGEANENFDITLEGQLEETDGEYELSLTVADEEGMFLPEGSIVTLERNLHTIGGHTYPHWEGGGRLDIAGRVLLSGAKLGPKKVRVSVRDEDDWLEYECFFDVEQPGKQLRQVNAKFLSRSTIHADGLVRSKAKFGLSGTISELRSGKPVLAVYPDVWYHRVPQLTPRELLYDFLPNKIYRGPFQTAAFGDAPPESDRFASYSLKAGRYIAMGYDEGWAPTFSDIVELTEEFPRADNLKLRYDVAGSVEGVVRDTNGKPLANIHLGVTGTGPISTAAVTALDELIRKSHGEGPYRMSQWKTDAIGRYKIDGLSTEIPIRVIALHPTREPASSRTVFVTPGITTASLDLQFRRERAR